MTAPTAQIAKAAPFKRILVPMSCSPEAREGALELSIEDLRMFRQALWLAKQCGAELLILHVVDFVDERALKNEPSVAEQAWSAVMPQLTKLRQLADLDDVATTATVKTGRPYYEILRVAHEFKADLIVMSPRRDNMKLGDRIRYGSTSRRIARKAACPVWFVGPESSPKVNGVLALVDRTPVSEEVVAAAKLIATMDEPLHGIMHCPEYPDDIVLRRLPHANKMIRAHHRHVRTLADEQLSGWTGGADAGWTVHLEDDWVVRAAPRLAGKSGYDLLVLACVSYPLLRGLLLGTTAERVMERNPYSTLVVRPKGWVSPISFDDVPSSSA